jgi:hypothetical protein
MRLGYAHFASNRDRYATPRAGTPALADAILPWRVVDEPPPPPVPPKREPSARARPAASSSGGQVPKRVTPWLLRRVNTSASLSQAAQAAQVQVTRDRLPQKASSIADIKGSPPKPPPLPPSYQQLQVRPSEESFRVVVPPPRQSKDNVAKTANHPVVVSSFQVLVHTPSKPTLADRSAKARKAPSSHSRAPSPQPSFGSIREDRLCRGAAAASTARRPARLPKPAQPPGYHYPEPFPAAPPPYREESSPPSGRSRSLPRSRKHSSPFEKEAPLPALPDHPPLSASAVSRIQAAYKVSNQFGDAVKRQEVRLAIPTFNHTAPVSAFIPHAGQRYMTAAEIDSHRKAKQRMNRSPRDHDANQRTLSKPRSYGEVNSSESRRRAASANSGRGNHDTKSRIR